MGNLKETDNGLLIPSYIITGKEEEKRKETLAGGYVNKDDVVLDPKLLTKTMLERMPEPKGWRILILPYRGKAVTDGGIIVPEGTREDEALASVMGYVLKMGKTCYQEERFMDERWCEVGDWVMIGRYAGARQRLDGGEEVRIINDDEVIGTILNPDDIRTL
jgi:co-chaperonin GroES (HSP10)